MKRIFSVICIIFLLGVTTAVPFYGSSCFVYAEGQNEQLDDSQIINAGISVYLNARNGFITIADGTISGARILMNNYVDSFLLFYNANHTVQEQISKSSLIGNILVNYNPFRVSLKGSAISFFNGLYDYLEDQGKLDNASNSNGGNTTDNLYDGYENGGGLFYIFKGAYRPGQWIDPTDLECLGTAVNGCNTDYLYNLYMNSFPNADWLSTTSQADVTTVPISCTYSANYTYSGTLQRKRSSSAVADNIKPFLGQNGGSVGNVILYSTRVEQVRGCYAWVIFRGNPNNMYCTTVAYNATTNKYWVSSYFRQVTINNDPPELVDINFETEDFDKNSTAEPDTGKEIQYTPRSNTTNNTYNTYNEYINDYHIKNTKIIKKIINEGEEEETTQPTSQNPYPLDPTDPSAPTGGTVPDWTTPSGNGGSGTLTPDGNGGFTFNLPDFEMPDLDINWSISGLAEKFPFSIPFDLLAFFTVLNAEPQTPAIQATIPLGIWEWVIDWDLHDFDNLAGLLRNLEFIGFCIGLALITRNIIKG